MKITLKEWESLYALAQAASAALDALDDRLTDLCLERALAGHLEESALLRKLGNRALEAQQLLYAHQFKPQSEWTGGDSSDPKNFKMREPNAVSSPGIFPADQQAAT